MNNRFLLMNDAHNMSITLFWIVSFRGVVTVAWLSGFSITNSLRCATIPEKEAQVDVVSSAVRSDLSLFPHSQEWERCSRTEEIRSTLICLWTRFHFQFLSDVHPSYGHSPFSSSSPFLHFFNMHWWFLNNAVLKRDGVIYLIITLPILCGATIH